MPDDLVYRVRSASEGWGGAPGLNTFYFDQDLNRDTDPAGSAQTVVTRVTAFWTAVSGCFPTLWSVQVNPVVDVINTDNGDLSSSYVAATPAAVDGHVGAVFGPQVAMICADLLTVAIIDGRRVHGRAFFGPLIPAADADGTPISADVSAVQGALTDLMTGATTDPNLVVWSRRKGASLKHPTGLGGSAHLVSGVTVKDSYAILRSRRQ